MTYNDKKNEQEKYELEEDNYEHLENELDNCSFDNSDDLSNYHSWKVIDSYCSGIDWVWQNWIANGYVTMIAGTSGVGKSYLLLRLCGCFTDGLNLPDGKKFERERGLVLWCEGEAAQNLNSTRAKLMGLDISRILFPFRDPFTDLNMENKYHLQIIKRFAYRDEIKLIVVDSLSGVHGSDENSSEMNKAVKFFARLARDSKKPIILTHHLNKSAQYDSEILTLNRIRGSSAIVQNTRIVIGIDQPDFENSTKRINVLKSNLSTFPEPIGFNITEKGIEFVPSPNVVVNKSQMDEARKFIKEILANGPVDAEKVIQSAKNTGISERTLNIAKKSLHARSIKVGGSEGKWKWCLITLPGQSDQPSREQGFLDNF